MLEALFEGVLLESLKKINLNFLQEIRLRENTCTTCLYGGKWYYLSISGLDNRECMALTANGNLINKVIQKASNNSLYTVSDQIKNGYITFLNGIRIGISGNAIYGEDGSIKSFTKITSLCIRIPHLIQNASNLILDKTGINLQLKNILILSQSGCGKTTILKDIALNLSKNPENNLVVIDEKEEFSVLKNKGLYLDILSQIDKFNGVNFAIRNLNPKVIITDEIGIKNDYDAIIKASVMGAKIICSKHAKSITDLKKDTDFTELIEKQIFDYYITLDENKGKGQLKNIFDKNFKRLEI